MTRSAFRTALEDILGVPRGSLQDSDSRDSVESWSSLADVQIFTTVASDLGFEPDGELAQQETVGELIGYLEERGAFSA